ncbi:glycosyltransferase family 4 protein (plasmid) [Cetobacterium somerae]|uniref:glycosyltransferase family 4 protein n=1 Tax=Cetobacterium somerae TaxID=188913 RepID=UPI003D76A42A
MKIVYVATDDAENKNSWSGTTYYLYKNLKENNEIINISPIKVNDFAFKVIYKILTKVTGKTFLYSRNRYVAKMYSNYINKKLKKISDYDCILSIGTLPTAFLKVDKPIFMYTDATFDGIKNYYKEFSNLSQLTEKEGYELEKRALENYSKSFYSSDWAKESAVKHYKILKEKIEVIPFGLNMDKIPLTNKILENIEMKYQNPLFKLLFVGKDYDRKGGAIAVEALKKLRTKGYNIELTIVGCNPLIKDSNIKIIPYINKNNKKEYEIYKKLLKESHFLLLPTKADCTPMVSKEANSYGIPTIISNTGGIPSIVKNNVNGILIENYEEVEEFIEKIEFFIENRDEYKKISIKTREYFENNLTWEHSTNKILEVMKEEIEKWKKK